MPFMVIYSTSDGRSCHQQADAIDEAALLVERLRNQDGIEDIRIYRMEEISFAFRPYYKVELGLPDRQTPAPPSDVVGGTNVIAGPPTPPPLAARPTAASPAPVIPEPDPGVAEASAVPPPPAADPLAEGAAANGARRGLFGR